MKKFGNEMITSQVIQIIYTRVRVRVRVSEKVGTLFLYES